MLLQELASPRGVAITQEGELVSSEELLFLNLATIKAATDDFSETNKLGQGGFGAVYKVIHFSEIFFWSKNFVTGLKLCLILETCISGCSTRWE